MSQQEIKLQNAITALSKYYGIKPIETYIEQALANSRRDRTISGITNEITSPIRTVDATRSQAEQAAQVQQAREESIRGATSRLSAAVTAENPNEQFQSELIRRVIDTSMGASLTFNLINQMNSLIGEEADPSDERIRNLFQLFEIYYGLPGSQYFYRPMENIRDRYKAIVGTVGDGATGMIPENFEPPINTQPDNPTKEHPSIAIYVSKHPRISLNLRNANACTIFFNGMPPLELSRAVPYIDVKMFLPRPSITNDRRLYATSLVKFLGGAKIVNVGTPEYTIAKANEIAGSLVSNNGIIPTYTTSGMEMFLSPQTLVNADETDDPTIRANPVLDKFRPFLSLENLDIEIAPSMGEMCTKSAKLKLRLHDRSRMNDIADFLKADLYSSQEIEIEYGWSHPDNNINSTENSYADLINGMRVKEKFSVVSSNFSFLENGAGVSIELSLMTRGAANMITQGIFNYSEETQGFTRRLREIQQTISQIRSRMYPTPQGEQRPREVRGTRLLDMASDASPLLSLGRDSQIEYRAFRRELERSHTPDAQQLLANLTQLFINATDQPRISRGGTTRLSRELFAVGAAGDAAFQTATARVREAADRVGTAEAAASDPALAARRRDADRAETQRQIERSRVGSQTIRASQARASADREVRDASVISGLRNSIISQVQAQLQTITLNASISDSDPFYIETGINPHINSRNRPGAVLRVPDTQIVRRLNESGTEARITSEERKERREQITAADNIRARYIPADRSRSPAENSFCSLGTLLLHFIGKPLASTHNYDEIQFIYYPFNEKAGFASKITTANFLIDLRLFEEMLIRNRIESIGGNAGMTLIEFMRFLQRNFFDDQSSYSYGLFDGDGALMRRAIDETTGRETSEPADDLPQFQSRINNLLQTVTPGGNFQLPQIELLVETVPAKLEAEGIAVSGDKTVLRLHVFDASATAYSTESSILEALREDQLGILNNVLPGPTNDTQSGDDSGNGDVQRNRQQQYRDAIQAAVDFGAIQIQTPEGVTSLASTSAQQSETQIRSNSSNIQIFGGSRNIKEYLIKTAPHIIYGAMGSTIITANLSSQSDATMQTLGILASPQQNTLLPNGQLPGGLPMQIIPNELNLTSMGNPLVSYMQNFFIDFQTGTTLDNIYYITGLSHKIENGKFTTQMTLAMNDAYQRYNNLNSRISNMLSILQEYQTRQPTSSESTT
jgi:hypothetical protein